MRAKIFFPCLLLLALAAGLVFWPRATPPFALAALVQTAEMSAPAVSARVALEPLPFLMAAEVPSRADELAELALGDEATALEKILPALTDVDAAVQCGSRAALPALRSALVGNSDFREATALQTAIDFLELPSVAEVAAGW
jgi:hypothetical protein